MVRRGRSCVRGRRGADFSGLWSISSGEIGPRQVRMACQSLFLLAIDEKLYLGDLRHVGMQGAKHGQQCKGFHLNA